MKEIWKDIKGFKNYYQISNLGRVKSLHRIIIDCDGYSQTWPERILKLVKIGSKDKELYVGVNLHKKNKNKTCKVHILVATHFIAKPKNLNQVNHKDRDKTNNHVYNLEWVDNRENCSYHQISRKNKTSKLLGAIFDKSRKLWISSIRINGTAKHLGRFNTQEAAAAAYKKALKKYGLKNRYAI